MGNKTTVSTVWRGEIPIYISAATLFGACMILLAQKGVHVTFEPVIANSLLLLASVIAIGLIDSTFYLLRKRPLDPWAQLKARYSWDANKGYILRGLPCFIILISLLPFFSLMKSAIPLFNDYTWDDTFIAADRAIFGGYDAWEILQPALGFPIVTSFLAFLYHLWVLLLYPGCLFFAFWGIDPHLKRQFFMTYILSWCLLGFAMATIWASVGPCFVGPLLGNPIFDGQLSYLQSANEQFPVLTLVVQKMLVDQFAADASGLGSGISAMPSLHVAIAFLFWLAVRRHSKFAGAFFATFFVIIWISSVHLAYHYAVDGLASVISVTVLWKLSDAIFRAWDHWLLKQTRYPIKRTNTAPAE